MKNQASIWLAVLLLPMSFARSELKGASTPEYRVPEPGSYHLPAIKKAADGALIDSRGRSVRLRDLTRGRVTVLSFIYTRCASAKACPYATGVLKEMHELSATDPVLAANLRLVSMSFDPSFDTPKT